MELLVAIGIIAILMAILLPVLGRARRMARATACAANLQQWASSFQMYLNGNGGKSFADRQTLTGQTWYEALQPYNGNVHDTLLCPDATDPGNVIGSASKAWGPVHTYDTPAPEWRPRGEFVGSYGFNRWLFRLPSEAQSAPTAPKYIGLPAPHADAIPVLADCIAETATPDDTDTVPTDLQSPIPFYSGTGPKPTGPSGFMAYYCIDRHDRAVNVAFLDGHAARVPLAGLWGLRWNAGFTPRDVTIPP
jgi:prepilin-type processing-associated H-X9-DG protein